MSLLFLSLSLKLYLYYNEYLSNTTQGGFKEATLILNADIKKCSEFNGQEGGAAVSRTDT